MDELPERTPRVGQPNLAGVAELFQNAAFDASNHAVADRLLELYGDRREAAVLDVGTGTARIAVYVATARPAWRVTGIDVSPEMLEAARQNVERAGLAASISLVHSFGEQIPAPSGSFDIVLANYVLHYMNDTDKFWRELVRVAKPGAVVLVRDIVRSSGNLETENATLKSAGQSLQPLRDHFRKSLLAAYTPDEVKEQLRKAGLEKLTVVSDGKIVEAFGSL
jgi:ubiquinone/menaquinone biosynthesis C-methylase UbiE